MHVLYTQCITYSQTQLVPVAKACPINPVPGGGALKIGEGGNGSIEGGSKDGMPTQRARATGIIMHRKLIVILLYDGDIHVGRYIYH